MNEDELQMDFVDGHKTAESAASDAWTPPLAGFMGAIGWHGLSAWPGVSGDNCLVHTTYGARCQLVDINTKLVAITEGLLRAVRFIIGDKSARTFYLQALLGLLLSIIFVSSALTSAKGLVHARMRSASLTYIRLSSFQCLSSAIETAVSSATRSLDEPDIPLNN